MNLSHYTWPMAAYAAGAATLFCAMLLVLTKQLHGHISAGTLTGVQCFHTDPTPRIGGIAIVFGLIVGAVLSKDEAHRILLVLLLIGAPAFAFGLLEDFTHRVSVATRLFATIGSGLLGWFVTGVSITDINVPLVDTLLMWTPVSVLFTAFAVGGIANAFNIIDGFNGLASGAGIIALSAMGILSLMLGDVQLGNVCLVLAALKVGFLVVNWPFGKLFLGDGGAYFLGFSVAWVAVLLLDRHPEVSAWCPLLICAYPVLEVGFSYRRKSKRSGHSPGQPDRVHLHMLVFRRITRPLFSNHPVWLQNGMTSPFMWVYALLPAIWAVLFAQDTPLLVVGFGLAALLYGALYRRLTQFRWSFGAWTLQLRARAAAGSIPGSN